MTLNNAPWAIDGARSTAGLARLASYAGGGGRSGIIKPADLRVSPLATPGNGLRLGVGGAVILNRYLSNPDESYVVSNPSTHTVLAANMPSAKGSTSYYLVCIVVGDPEFNQTGHPFMPSTVIPPENRADFSYVRTVIVPCTSTTTSFDQLGYLYPAIALARLEVPANTTTITGPMITDLRSLAQARYSNEVLSSRPGAEVRADFNGWVWFGPAPFVTVPPWATTMKVLITLAGLGSTGSVYGQLRALINGDAGNTSAIEVYDINSPISGDPQRSTVTLLLDKDVRAFAGNAIELSMQANALVGLPDYLFADGATQYIHDVRFSERAV